MACSVLSIAGPPATWSGRHLLLHITELDSSRMRMLRADWNCFVSGVNPSTSHMCKKIKEVSEVRDLSVWSTISKYLSSFWSGNGLICDDNDTQMRDDVRNVIWSCVPVVAWHNAESRRKSMQSFQISEIISGGGSWSCFTVFSSSTADVVLLLLTWGADWTWPNMGWPQLQGISPAVQFSKALRSIPKHSRSLCTKNRKLL